MANISATSGPGVISAAAPGPELNGLLAWNIPPYSADVNRTPTAATIHLMKIMVPKTTVFTNILATVSTAGTSYTNAQFGLYSSAGTFLSACTVRATGGTDTFATTGVKTLALSAAQTIVGSPTQFVWVGAHFGTNAATAVAFAGGGFASGVSANMGTTASTAVMGTIAGHATNPLATIGNITPASIDSTIGSGCVAVGIT